MTSLGRAVGAVAADSVGNIAGMAIPGAMGGTAVKKVLSGAIANAGQDTAVRAALSNIAETKEVQDKFAIAPLTIS